MLTYADGCAGSASKLLPPLIKMLQLNKVIPPKALLRLY
jgi:hypothetical protein